MPNSHLGLGLAALGRPAYITAGRASDFGHDRSVDALRARAHEVLDAAWASGIRYVDAARSYGLAEEFLGSWLAAHPDHRASLTIGSKWGYRYVGDWRMDAEVHELKEHSAALFDRQWQETLAALGTTPDVYLVHSVTPESPALSDPMLLDRLRALAADGVRVGFSTSGPSQGAVLEAALALPSSPYSAVQSTWNLREPSAGPALARAHAAGWLVVVKESFANGRLTMDGAEPDILDAAASAGLTPEALALGAVLAQPWADIVLTGAVTPAQLASNASTRAHPLAAATAAHLAEAPATYWHSRASRPWT